MHASANAASLVTTDAINETAAAIPSDHHESLLEKRPGEAVFGLVLTW